VLTANTPTAPIIQATKAVIAIHCSASGVEQV
jgi:hypothetical protein